jgi:hypothetical protein
MTEVRGYHMGIAWYRVGAIALNFALWALLGGVLYHFGVIG